MDMDEFLDFYLYFFKTKIILIVPYEDCELQEFHDWLPAWVDRAAMRVISSR